LALEQDNTQVSDKKIEEKSGYCYIKRVSCVVRQDYFRCRVESSKSSSEVRGGEGSEVALFWGHLPKRRPEVDREGSARSAQSWREISILKRFYCITIVK
jgi:hypothetical protein